MSTTPPRKGANRVADIPPDILEALSLGKISSATLTEGLAVDQYRLLCTVFPSLPPDVLHKAHAFTELGILRRMVAMGTLLQTEVGNDALTTCLAHLSDTVRGWACFMIGAQVPLPLDERLAAIRPLADDEHFGVREWSWMAVRPYLVNELDSAITLLTAWTASPSEWVRRFACEALRPRGVWCAHIAAFKKEPQLALPILEALRADPSVYVQDSVANWLNDAGKNQPNWVQALCTRWLAESPTDATQRICQRAQRNLK